MKRAVTALGRLRRDVRFLTALLCALALLIFSVQAGRPAWSADEAATLMVVRRSLSEVVRVMNFDPALLPYYLAMNAWAVPSTRHLWLRLPSMIAMTAVVLGVFAMGRRFGSTRLGLLAAAALLALPTSLRVAHDARPYAVSAAFVLAAVLLWVGRVDVRRLRMLGLAVAVALAGLAHPYTLLILGVLPASALLTGRGRLRRPDLLAAIAALAGAAAIAPFLVLVGRRAQGQPNPPPVTAMNVAEEFLRLPVHVLSRPLGVLGAVLILVLAGVGLIVGWRAAGRRREVTQLALVWGLLPPFALCLFQLTTGAPGLVARYWTFCLPALALALGLTLDWLWSRHALWAASALGLVVALAIPTHAFFLSVDGHFGRRWLEFPRVLAIPGLTHLPVLGEGVTYRGLVSNDPSIAGHMALVTDPVPSGRVNPRIADPSSTEFQRLATQADLVLVLQAETTRVAAPPSLRSFRDFREELRVFDVPVVLCRYFYDSLAVFAKSPSRPGRDVAISEAQAQEWASRIESIEPSQVRCVAVP